MRRCSCSVGVLLLFATSTVPVQRSVGEFICIICARRPARVLNSRRLRRSASALPSALIYGMANRGIVYSSWEQQLTERSSGIMLQESGPSLSE